MEKKVIGYTTGVYDLFHVGHLRLLKRAKEQCDQLIVGVTTDELVSYKYKKAVIPFSERKEIPITTTRYNCNIQYNNSSSKLIAGKSHK